MTITKGDALDFCFLALNFMFFCSFNGIIFMFTGVGQVASPFIFVACMAIIIMVGIRPESIGQPASFMLFMLLLTYYGIGLAMRFFYAIEVQYEMGWRSIFNDISSSIVVMLGYSQYFYQRLYLDQKRNKVLWYLLLPFLASISVLLIQPYFGVTTFNENQLDTSRGMGVFANPNTAGVTANLTLLLLIDSFFRSKKWLLLKLVAIPLVIWACIIPFSKMGIISMVVTLLAGMGYYFFKIRVDGKRHLLQSTIFIGLPILIGNYVYNNYDYLLEEYLDYAQRSRLETLEQLLIEQKVDSKTTSERTELIALSIDLIQRKPLFGYGMGYFNDIPGRIGVHNSYLLTFGNSGIIPFLLLLGLFGYLLIQSVFHPTSGFLILGMTLLAMATFMASHNGYDDKVLNMMFLIPTALCAYDRRLPISDVCVE